MGFFLCSWRGPVGGGRKGGGRKGRGGGGGNYVHMNVWHVNGIQSGPAFSKLSFRYPNHCSPPI